MTRLSEIRDPKELPLEQLLPYLADVLDCAQDSIGIKQFRSGHSNLTYLVTAGSHHYVLRRPPRGTLAKAAHDMGREFRLLSSLSQVASWAPTPHHFCEDENVLGAPFYLMDYVTGPILRKKVPKGLTLNETTADELSRLLVQTLVEIHAIKATDTGLIAKQSEHDYVHRQVHGWTARYRKAETDDIPAMNALAALLAAEQPKQVSETLIHNDFKFDNIVLDTSGKALGVKAVLDWEMATLGDPFMDLGTTLSYWVCAKDPDPIKQFAMAPTHQPGFLNRADIVALYQELSGKQIPNPTYYFRFGLFKTAVVAQQIYKRFKEGSTTDPRFAAMIMAVHLLSQMAMEGEL